MDIQPLPIAPGLDPAAVNMARAIRTTESNSNYEAQGKSGEFGAYQFLPSTWKSWAGQYLNDPKAEATPQNQDKVAYYKILDLKNQGYTPEQVASIWNSGKPNFEGNVGVNSKGVAFDTPKYVASVIDKYQQFKGGVENGPTLPNPSSTDQTAQSPSVGGFIGNIFKSGAGVVGNIANALFHPIQTVENIGKIAAGGVEKLIPGQQPQEQNFDAVKNFFVQRYGGLNNILNTAYNDPAGLALDVATLLTGGGALATKIGEASKLGQLAEAGNVASKVGEAVNPLGYLGKGASAVVGGGAKLAGRATAEALGLTTGRGGGAVEGVFQAARQGGEPLNAVTEALRGGITPEETLGEAKSALGTIKTGRSTAYKTEQAALKLNTTPIDTTPIYAELQKQLDEFNVKVVPEVKDQVGKVIQKQQIDFSNSPLAQGEGQNVVKKVYNDVSNWSDTTANGLDILKKRLGDYYSPSSQARAFVAPIIKQLDTTLKEVPGYAKLTSGYRQASQLIENIQKSLSLGDKASVDTSLKKLSSIVRQNNEFRVEMVKALEDASGKPLLAQISGSALSGFAPSGLSKYGEGLAVLHNPALLAGLPFASPRIVGELARALGLTQGKLESVIKTLSKTKAGQVATSGVTSKALFQAGRFNRVNQ